MLNILKKTTESMAKITRSTSPAQPYDVVEDVDLSAWELVNASQSDDEDLFSFDTDDDVTSEEDDVTTESKPEDEEEEEVTRRSRDLPTVDVVMAIQAMSVSPPMSFPVEVTRVRVYDDDVAPHDDDDDVDDDDMYDDGIDDELMPWKLKDRYGKQRITKLGKRGPKPNRSKRMPCYYNSAARFL